MSGRVRNILIGIFEKKKKLFYWFIGCIFPNACGLVLQGLVTNSHFVANFLWKKSDISAFGFSTWFYTSADNGKN